VKIATLGNAEAIHTRRWVEHFRSRGHTVRLWSLEPGPKGSGAERLPSLPLPRFLRYPLAAPALARAFAEYQPDLVDAHFVPNYGLIARLVGRRPLSVTAWGSDLLLAKDPLRRARSRWVLGRADLVLCDAEILAKAAREAGAPPERVHAIPWGVDLDRFRPAARREPGLILSTRSHETVYDLETAIAGLVPVLASREDLHVVFTGDGLLRPSLEQLAAEKLPAGRFRFTGRLDGDELAGWYGRAEIYLSASRSDSTSQSLLEAMAAEAVPVVSDIAGNREWVSDGEGARLFTAGDPVSLAGALTAALSDELWRERTRARNREVVVARGDWTRNLGRIESLFETLVRGARS
jgi:glycosyltransferase involved in cell wall biosynthesis